MIDWDAGAHDIWDAIGRELADWGTAYRCVPCLLGECERCTRNGCTCDCALR